MDHKICSPFIEKQTQCCSDQKMHDHDIVLWYGNIGVCMDEYGNVYEVQNPQVKDKDWAVPDLVTMYQSILREIGYKIDIYKEEIFVNGMKECILLPSLWTPADRGSLGRAGEAVEGVRT